MPLIINHDIDRLINFTRSYGYLDKNDFISKLGKEHPEQEELKKWLRSLSMRRTSYELLDPLVKKKKKAKKTKKKRKIRTTEEPLTVEQFLELYAPKYSYANETIPIKSGRRGNTKDDLVSTINEDISIIARSEINVIRARFRIATNLITLSGYFTKKLAKSGQPVIDATYYTLIQKHFQIGQR